MSTFSVSTTTTRPVTSAWQRLVDWPAHAQFVPLTTMRVDTPGPNGLGTVFVARTALGRLGFDDPMEITAWDPPADDDSPGECRIEKRGRLLDGWAVLRVEPHGRGSRATWTEQIQVRRLPRFTDGLTAASSRVLFGRVLRRLLA